MSSLPMKHIDLPLGATFKANSIWDGIFQKLERLLVGWKGLYLSKGGRHFD